LATTFTRRFDVITRTATPSKETIMWRNLAVAIATVVGFGSQALFAEDGGLARPEVSAGRPGAITTGLRRTGERRPEPPPSLSDFVGVWRGEAVDYPEDGTSTDPVGVKLTLSQRGELEGMAFDRFTGGDETRLEDVHVAGDRLEFKVRYRTGVQMRVTLGLAADTLKGEGIPIRSDSDRCHIVLRRQRTRPPLPKGGPSEARPSDFAGQWRGEAVDYPEDGSSTDPVGVKLTISQRGELEGMAFDRFTGGDETRLEDIHVAGDRLEFKVRHRTGVQMRVTLGLAGNKLKGEAIPIRSDEDRCRITLERCEEPDQPRGQR
jgi:hypothetical protein